MGYVIGDLRVEKYNMILHKNWIITNICDRLQDRACKFEVTINPYEEEISTDFESACLKAAREIGNKYGKIFLGLSGGLDSTYVFKVLTRAEIGFIPIIVSIKGSASNRMEVSNALSLCKENNIKHSVVIKATEKERLEKYFNETYRKVGSFGYFSASSVLAAEYAKAQGGTYITGEHFLNDNQVDRSLILNDYDVQHDALFGDDFFLPFFLYNLDMTYHMVKVMLNAQNTKKLLYKDDRIRAPLKIDDAGISSIVRNIQSKVNMDDCWKSWPRVGFFDLISSK